MHPYFTVMKRLKRRKDNCKYGGVFGMLVGPHGFKWAQLG